MNVDPDTGASEIEKFGTSTVKSDARPVVGPFWSDTLITHVICTVTRCGYVVLHESVDAVVGVPYTGNITLPPILFPDPCSVARTANCVVGAAGVTVNVNVLAAVGARVLTAAVGVVVTT